MRPALVIHNPQAGGRNQRGRLSGIAAGLRAGGFDTAIRATEEPEHATRIARAAAEAGDYDAIFGLGGDGTLREIAAGLVGSPIPMGILPAGTVNVLALALGVPRDARRASRCYRAEPELRTRRLDVGVFAGRPFLMMVSAGVDAAVLARVQPRAKRRWGRLAVAAQVAPALLEYDFPRFMIATDELTLTGSFVVASNIPQYGGGFRIAPAADPGDGRLDLTVFGGSGRLATLGFALRLLLGRLARGSRRSVRRIERARLEGPASAWVQVDGDPVRVALPAELGLHPGSLRILLPATRRDRALTPSA